MRPGRIKARDVTRRRALLAAGVAAVALSTLPTRADVGPPAHLRISEREAGVFVTEWRVPKALPPRAVPTPDLPDACGPLGPVTTDDQARAWLFSQDWRCDSGLAGDEVGLRFPFADLALTTVIRVDLLSGDRFAHVSSPGEGPWRLPEGTAAPDLWGEAARAVRAGLLHVVGSWIHFPFVLAVGLLGGFRRPARVATAFTLGQLPGVLIGLFVPGLGIAPAEIALGIAAALIAREGLEPTEQRRRLFAMAAIGGAIHGLAAGTILAGGPGGSAAGILSRFLAVLGMDAGHIAAVVTVAAAAGFLAPRRAATAARNTLLYASGAGGVALALGLALTGGTAEPVAAQPVVSAIETGAGAGPSASAGSRRLGPATSDAPVQSYLVVEPFEVRHEVMIRLGGLAESLELDPNRPISVADQPDLLARLIAFVVECAAVGADGSELGVASRRADFMSVDATGALPRSTAVPEPVADAVVGVVVSYATGGIPREVTLRWDPFPAAAASVPVTLIDPESVDNAQLTGVEPMLTWTNSLTEDPIPTVAAIEVEPIRITVPLLSLSLLAAASAGLIAGRKRRRTEASIAAARVLLALAVLSGPFAQVTLASFPGSMVGTPSERQARRILAGLLPNIYRAMEFREEGLIYDRLAISVTGDTLTDVYLEQRRTLEMAERGGAQARVEAVEVLEAGEIERQERGFGVHATWTASGMVTHFGHRHFRQNRYDARIAVVPVDGAWKIRSIEMLEQDRLK